MAVIGWRQTSHCIYLSIKWNGFLTLISIFMKHWLYGKSCTVLLLSWWAMTTLWFMFDVVCGKSTITEQFYLLHKPFPIYYFHPLICWPQVTELYMFCFWWFGTLEIHSHCLFNKTCSREPGLRHYFDWLLHAYKKISQPGQSAFFFSFWLFLSCQKRCPAVDLYVCTVDMEHRQSRGHHQVGRWQLIRHTQRLTKKAHRDHFPQGSLVAVTPHPVSPLQRCLTTAV